MGDPSKEKVVELINQGIKQAEDYLIASGLPFWDGPEYFMTTYIFRSILGYAKRNCLTLELKPGEIEKYLELKGRPPLRAASARMEGRGDICLWYKDTNKPRAIIEVKRDVKNCYADLERVVQLVGCKNGLEFGVLCSSVKERVKGGSFGGNAEETAKTKIDGKLAKVETKILNLIKGYRKLKKIGVSPPKKGTTFQLKCDGDNKGDTIRWVWSPACFLIYRNADQ